MHSGSQHCRVCVSPGAYPAAEGPERSFVASRGVMWQRKGAADPASSQEYAHTKPQRPSEACRGQAACSSPCIHGTASTSPTRQELWWALVWDLTPRPGLLGGSLPAVARGTVSCSRFLVATLCTQLKYSAKRQTRTSHCLKIILSSPCLH